MSLMRTVLLTWYGITDLRASLEMESSDGPVLSALKTGEFTDVVILAYTDPEKKKVSISDDFWSAWEEWSTDPRRVPREPIPDELFQVISSLSNTSTAHDHFSSWLEGKLSAAGVNVQVQLHPQTLKHLNDVAGIHSAASAAVKSVLDDSPGSPISVYLSPGTPVMAFSWALIARSNPHLDINVIASSDPRRPPERVELPRKLLDPVIASGAGIHDATKTFDLVIHLMGEQALPILFGIRQFPSDNTVLLTSARYKKNADQLKRTVVSSAKVVTIADPFVPSYTREAITKQVGQMPVGARIAVNMTGGTKIMFAGALQACWELGLDPFYFEVNDHKVIFLRDGSKHEFVGLPKIEDFISASGFRIFSKGRLPRNSDLFTEQRFAATEALWLNRSKLQKLYRKEEFRDFLEHWSYCKRNGRKLSRGLVTDIDGKSSLVVKRDGTSELKIDGQNMVLPSGEQFDYVAGRWLEDYMYELLLPLLTDGTIRDLRIGCEVAFPDSQSPESEWPVQEFYGVFSDGKRLWIVECKAGSADQVAIQKLDNNIRHYGGVAARGILITSSKLSKHHVRRLENLPSIHAVEPDLLSTNELRKIITKAKNH